MVASDQSSGVSDVQVAADPRRPAESVEHAATTVKRNSHFETTDVPARGLAALTNSRVFIAMTPRASAAEPFPANLHRRRADAVSRERSGGQAGQPATGSKLPGA